jgi:polyphosphate kinase 2 (PPK2 family)
LRILNWLLHRFGHVVTNIWLDITKPEQKKRFKARHKDKPWKVSDSDAIARANWGKYTPAANEMFHRTGTDFAPWFIVPADDKRFSRIAILRIVNQRLRDALAQAAVEQKVKEAIGSKKL